jgi:hypothetical protein
VLEEELLAAFGWGDVEYGDLIAVGCQALRDRSADAGSAAGDDRGPSMLG